MATATRKKTPGKGNFVQSRQRMMAGSSKLNQEKPPVIHAPSIKEKLAKFQNNNQNEKKEQRKPAKKRLSGQYRRTSWVQSPQNDELNTSAKKRLQEELENLKKRGQVRNNDFTKGKVAENAVALPGDRKKELEHLQDDLTNDPHAAELSEKRKRAAARKAARARGEVVSSSSEEEEVPSYPGPKRRGSKRLRRVSHNSTDASARTETEEKVHSPIPSSEKSPDPASPEGIQHSPITPISATLAARVNNHRCSLAISRRESLQSGGDKLELDMFMDADTLDTGMMVPEVIEDEDTSDDEHVPAPDSSYNEPETQQYNASAAVADIVKGIVTETALPTQYNPTFSVDNDEGKRTSEHDQMEDYSDAEVTNEAELEALTLLRGAIEDLQDKVDRLSSNHPGYAVDCKLLLILQTLERRFTSPAGKRILQKEADNYHEGNIFDAEKSFIHTFRQSLLLRMAPPTARKFHDHKNTELRSER